jgi:hypothetical protein
MKRSRIVPAAGTASEMLLGKESRTAPVAVIAIPCVVTTLIRTETQTERIETETEMIGTVKESSDLGQDSLLPVAAVEEAVCTVLVEATVIVIVTVLQEEEEERTDLLPEENQVETVITRDRDLRLVGAGVTATVTVDVMTVDVMTVDVMTVDVMTVDAMTVDVITVDVMTVDVMTVVMTAIVIVEGAQCIALALELKAEMVEERRRMCTALLPKVVAGRQ